MGVALLVFGVQDWLVFVLQAVALPFQSASGLRVLLVFDAVVLSEVYRSLFSVSLRAASLGFACVFSSWSYSFGYVFSW